MSAWGDSKHQLQLDCSALKLDTICVSLSWNVFGSNWSMICQRHYVLSSAGSFVQLWFEFCRWQCIKKWIAQGELQLPGKKKQKIVSFGQSEVLFRSSYFGHQNQIHINFEFVTMACLATASRPPLSKPCKETVSSDMFLDIQSCYYERYIVSQEYHVS